MKLKDITNREESFAKYLNENNLTNIGVEVGVKYGKNADKLLTNWVGKRLFLIDNWPISKIKAAAVQKLKHHAPRYTLIHNTSLKALEKFEDNTLDFCYIDAKHTYNRVKQDVYGWYLKTKPGGVLAGHDYNVKDINYIDENTRRKKPWRHIGVKKAVDEFVKEKNILLHVEPAEFRKSSSWYITKEK